MHFATPYLRIVGLAVLIGGLWMGAPKTGYGQAPLGQGQGTATLEDWPRSLPQLLDDMGPRAPYLLPKIDSLALDYRYEAADTSSHWRFALSWRPGNRVLHQGNVLPWRQGPSDIRMVNVELRAEVRVEGEAVAEMIVAVDSMALGPVPGRFPFSVRVSHDRVFLDTSAEEARRILSEGASLGSLVVERMGFSSASTERPRGPEARRERSDAPRSPRIYESRTQVYVGWRIGPRLYYVGDGGETAPQRPRREPVGRTADADDARREGGDNTEGGRGNRTDSEEGSKREGTRSSSEDSDEDDEEEEETDLRLPALGAVAAVAVLGYAAGTVGVYGRGDTPIGLAAGWTDSDGGAYFHAAVNRAVLEDQPGQKLTAKALGFYNVFDARVQPAVGIGAQVDPQREGLLRPSFSIGLAGNFNPVVLYGGIDLVQQTPEVGLTYNFRLGGSQDEETDDAME